MDENGHRFGWRMRICQFQRIVIRFGIRKGDQPSHGKMDGKGTVRIDRIVKRVHHMLLVILLTAIQSDLKLFTLLHVTVDFSCNGDLVIGNRQFEYAQFLRGRNDDFGSRFFLGCSRCCRSCFRSGRGIETTYRYT